MFITAVCVLFLSFFVSLVSYFAVTCYVKTATDWKILERPKKKIIYVQKSYFSEDQMIVIQR